jgi:rubrerythrin
MTKRKTHEEFIDEFYNMCQSIDVLGTYKTTDTPIECRCKDCNHVWFPTPNKLLHGRRCPVCANKKRGIHIERKEFIDKLGKANTLVELVGEYEGGHRKTSFKCVKCGTIWEASPYSLLAGHGCPLCAHTGTSFSEQFITNALKYALGEENVITRSKKLIGKELDIYIPGKRIAIEYNGWFWHKNKIASDIKKAELCVQSNCRLISIYDACPETYLPLNNDYITFEKDLALEPGYTTLKTLVELLLDEYLHCQTTFNESAWEQIIHKSLLNSRKKSTEEFKKEFYSLCDSIEILGEYKKSSIPIACRCKICGYEWSVTPNDLLCGSRCADCSGVRKLTHNEFINRLSQKNESYRKGEIEVLDNYISSSHKITVKCAAFRSFSSMNSSS